MDGDCCLRKVFSYDCLTMVFVGPMNLNLVFLADLYAVKNFLEEMDSDLVTSGLYDFDFDLT